MRIQITSEKLLQYLHTILTAMATVHAYWQEYETHFTISLGVSIYKTGYGSITLQSHIHKGCSISRDPSPHKLNEKSLQHKCRSVIPLMYHHFLA